MVTIYNYTEKPIAQTIRGTHVIVPAKGSTTTSQRKANQMIEENPRKLGLQQRFYTDGELKRAAKLPADAARKALVAVMEGKQIDVAEYEPKGEAPTGDDDPKA